MQSTFLQEIEEQPAALCKLVDFYSTDGRSLLEQWRNWAEQSHRVVFCGMGTSEVVAEFVLPKLAAQGLDATTIDAGELLHYPRCFGGLTVFISQSGESAETKKMADLARHSGQFVSITNNPESSIAQWAPLNLPMLAGEECAIATKTYVNSLGVLYLMAAPLSHVDDALDQLKAVAQTMINVPRQAIEKAADLLADAQSIHCVARGPALAAAKQAALTYTEGFRISVASLTGGLLRHGPLEMLDSSYRCLIFLPQGKTFELLRKVSVEIAESGGHVVAITDDDLELPGKTSCVIKVPQHGEDLFSLSAAAAQGWLLEAIARRRGILAGIFRHGQKITTLE